MAMNSFTVPALFAQDALVTEQPIVLVSKREIDQIVTAETQGAELGGNFPKELLKRYIERGLRRCSLELMEDGRYFATIKILNDVWAEGATPEEATTTLEEVTRQWVLMHIEEKTRALPVLDGINLNWI